MMKKSLEFYDGYNLAIDEIAIATENKIKAYFATDQSPKAFALQLMKDDIEMMRK